MHGWPAPLGSMLTRFWRLQPGANCPGTASDALVRWCDAELIPQALAEEQAMYPAAHEDPRARLLVDAMLAEHRDLVALVEAIRQATSPVRGGHDCSFY